MDPMETANFALRALATFEQMDNRQEDNYRQWLQLQVNEADKARQREIESSKFLVTTLYENLNRYKDDTTRQEILIRQAQSVVGALPPYVRQALEPMTQMGPISDVELKKRNFIKSFPPPKVTADPTKDPRGYAEQVFGFEDYKEKLRTFSTGGSPQYKRFLGLGNDAYAVRDETGLTQVVSGDQLKFEEPAKKYGVHPGEIVSGGGWIAQGDKIWSPTGKALTGYQAFTNVLTGETELRATDFKSNPFADGKSYDPRLLPNEFRRAVATIALDDSKLIKKYPEATVLKTVFDAALATEHSKGETVGKWLKSGGAIPLSSLVKLNQAVQRFWPGYGATIEVGDPHGLFGKQDFSIVPIPGMLMTLEINGKPIVVFADRQRDLVYDHRANLIGAFSTLTSQAPARSAVPLKTSPEVSSPATTPQALPTPERLATPPIPRASFVQPPRPAASVQLGTMGKPQPAINPAIIEQIRQKIKSLNDTEVATWAAKQDPRIQELVRQILELEGRQIRLR